MKTLMKHTVYIVQGRKRGEKVKKKKKRARVPNPCPAMPFDIPSRARSEYRGSLSERTTVRNILLCHSYRINNIFNTQLTQFHGGVIRQNRLCVAGGGCGVEIYVKYYDDFIRNIITLTYIILCYICMILKGDRTHCLTKIFQEKKNV